MIRNLCAAASLLAFTLLGCSSPAPKNIATGPCAPPAGFVDMPPPEAAPVAKLLSHVEEVTIDRPMAVAIAANESVRLEQAINRDSSLPGVSGTYDLTPGGFGQAGSRRMTCLTDGSTLVEQVLVRRSDERSAEFRYVVWNYTSETARPIVYGVGHFERTAVDAGHTHVKWTYSFQLNRSRFPGFLGPIGDWLFHVNFLDGPYAKMMRGTLTDEKARAEAMPATP
jgi:hypothetical protein